MELTAHGAEENGQGRPGGRRCSTGPPVLPGVPPKARRAGFLPRSEMGEKEPGNETSALGNEVCLEIEARLATAETTKVKGP